jgi:uracil-DNA glycosylase family 4
MASVEAKLEVLAGEIASCRACERLVSWREAAPDGPRRIGDPANYWARAVPGFGDPEAELLIVGLAPAAHGANRTGRMFTGDRSGDFLFAALHRAGLANQAASSSIGDGLTLHRTFVTAAVRCAPPDNQPTNDERDRCRSFLVRELETLRNVRVVFALGAFAFEALLKNGPLTLCEPGRRPKFAHGLELAAKTEFGLVTLIASYHPSQRNVFTGLLTPAMFDEVIGQAVAHLDAGSG